MKSIFVVLKEYSSCHGYLGKILICILGHVGLPGNHVGCSVWVGIDHAVNLAQVQKWAGRKAHIPIFLYRNVFSNVLSQYLKRVIDVT